MRNMNRETPGKPLTYPPHPAAHPEMGTHSSPISIFSLPLFSVFGLLAKLLASSPHLLGSLP